MRVPALTRGHRGRAAFAIARHGPGHRSASGDRRGDPAGARSTTVRTAKPLPHWVTGPVTLLGDASHTVIPVGKSAAVAVRAAAELRRRLAGRPGVLREAVRVYEEAMLDYGFRVVAESPRAAG